MYRLFILVLMFPLSLAANNAGFYMYQVGQNSWVAIHGSTNINEFTCSLDGAMSRGMIMADIHPEGESVFFFNASLDLPVEAFDCKNRFMNRDFRDALGGGESPLIQIRVLETRFPEGKRLIQDQVLIASVEILINGASKRTDVDVKIGHSDKLKFYIKGSKTLNMSDFNIKPPSPAMGLVKVDDTMDIRFSLTIEASMLSESF